jgi:hypothetical protein
MSDTALRRIGWMLSLLFGLFMLGASVLPKLAGMPVAQQTMAALNWPDAPLRLIGTLELISTLLFLLPATGLLGAVLMMAILGGAMATNLHGQAPLYSHTLFSVYLGALMWLGLILRDDAVRAIFPMRR